MKLNKAVVSAWADAQIKPYAPPLPINKNVVKKLWRRKNLSTPIEKLKIQSDTPRLPEKPETIILGDYDPTKFRVDKVTKIVTFSFLGYAIEMSWITAHQLRAQIGQLDPLPEILDAD